VGGSDLPHLKKGKGSPYSITEHRVPELIPVLGSQPAGDVSHKPGGKLPLLSARPAVTPATLKRAATKPSVPHLMQVFLYPHESAHAPLPNDTSIGSAVFAQLARVPH